MELLKLLNNSQIAAQIINFILLFIILRALVWKRFLTMLDDRKARIAGEFKNIEDAKAEIAKMKTDYEGRLDRIEDTAKARIQDAIAEGKKIAVTIREDAEAESKKLVENGKAAIRDEVLKAREKLRDEIIDIAVGAAEKVIEEKLTEGEDKRLVEDFIKRLDTIK